MDYDVWDLESGQPPQLEKFVGLLVGKAWIIRNELLIWLKPNFLLRIRRGISIGVDMLVVETGVMKTTMPWEQLDQFEGERWGRLDELTGLSFAGLDGPIVDFGNTGIAMLEDGEVDYVKRGAKE